MSGRLSEEQIAEWIANGEHFEARSDGEGLSLCYPARFTAPCWKLRYRQGGQQRVLGLGSYRELPLDAARKLAAECRAELKRGGDVAVLLGEARHRRRKVAGNQQALSRAFAVLLKQAASHGAKRMTVTVEFESGGSESWAS